ncbi:hypothetical protein KIW84_024309 [Lathyrus oleraceus]|uniref:ATP-dependent RNA helicase SUV3 DEXQ-box helicase domain-containing protein n=1 Tax=Pisum sativum TaxID=3888 RepID=A0A9D5B7J7_PEA|nr:hypothetical protein KIW84_024309 [Pisum sativum]
MNDQDSDVVKESLRNPETKWMESDKSYEKTMLRMGFSLEAKICLYTCDLIIGQVRQGDEGRNHKAVTVEMENVSTDYKGDVIDEIQES